MKPKGPGLVVIAPLPVSLTQDHAVGGVQSISNGSLLYTESSFLGPNNLFVLSGLTHPGETLNVHQITKFGEPVLRNKMLSQYEEIWFEGAESVQVQGWVVKPAGWSKADAKSTWPLMFLIHGGDAFPCPNQSRRLWVPALAQVRKVFLSLESENSVGS